jgi:hypothetical protein
MTIKIEKISASVYKVINNYYGPDFIRYYDTERRLVSGTPSFLYDHTQPMSNDDWEALKIWCKAQDLPFPNSATLPKQLPTIKGGTTSEVDTMSNPERYCPEPGTWVWVEETEPEPTSGVKYWQEFLGDFSAEPNTLSSFKHGVQADSVNVTLAKAETGQYRIEWRNSESGKTRFIVHCIGCNNSIRVAQGIAFAQCAKVTHPMSKPSNDLSDHP